jgi:NAD(P)H-hydrate epimerase
MATDPYGFPVIGGLPEIDAAGMAEVDLLMVDTYGITLPQMMENAGRALAILARDRFLGGQVSGKSVTVLAGSGGNGGGALTAARRLAGWGANVSLVLSGPSASLAPVPGQQLTILKRMGLCPMDEPRGQPELILDGLIGYSLHGSPRGRALDLIRWANASSAPVLALDVPSGFDAQAGTVMAEVVRATATLTLALPKRGLGSAAVRHAVGELYLADISVPPGLYERLTTPRIVPPFGVADILRLPL